MDRVGQLRKPEAAARRIICPECKAELDSNLEDFQAHVRDNVSEHGNLTGDTAIAKAFNRISLRSTKFADQSSNKLPKKRPCGPAALDSVDHRDTSISSRQGNKKVCSPTSSDQPHGSPNINHPVNKSRTRRNVTGHPSNPEQDCTGASRQPKGIFHASKDSQQQQTYGRRQPPPLIETQDNFTENLIDNPHTSITPQPDAKPISHEQLVAEVKGIYAGLVMIETKCIEVDNSQSTSPEQKLTKDQWQTLIALHRTLLHEHHDFFLGSQHPAANAALRRLASKYAMPARLWRYGIHSFLELLRCRLPDSYEYMLTFIYLAYAMMALLYETVPAFEDTWVECLGDLARYRMAIEDNDKEDREIWTGVARQWYSFASEKAPSTGRLYHHLAILARPNAVQQLYFYTKSLCVIIPFHSARESIMTLFDPVLTAGAAARLPAIDAAFVRVHGIFFSKKNKELLDPSIDDYYTGIPLCCSLLGYGLESNFIMKVISPPSEEQDTPGSDGAGSSAGADEAVPDEMFPKARDFAMKIYKIVALRFGDPNTLPFLHTFLAFMWHISKFPTAMTHLEREFPWQLTATMLNQTFQSCGFEARMESEEFPGALKNDTPRPLPEDFAMRSLVYTEDYLPSQWFNDSKVEEDEKQLELASMVDQRKERLLWLGRRIASTGRWLTWDNISRQFGVADKWADQDDAARLEM
uniref:DNA/RNA-binding domain-containing protein n=1 Tax=Bionectria ochroleuca TaxID=29856 RepID=A0A0B7KMS7_BIOOC